MLKSINMVTLLNVNVSTPEIISNHNNVCSTKAKVHQKLPRFLPDYDMADL